MGQAINNLEFWIFVLNHPLTGWTQNPKTMDYEFKLCGKIMIAMVSMDFLEDSSMEMLKSAKERVMEELLAAI